MDKHLKYLVQWLLVFVPVLIVSGQEQKKAEFNFQCGFSTQFFALEKLLLSPRTPRIEEDPFLRLSEGNAIGVGVPIGVTGYLPQAKLGLQYETTLRYDVISPEFYTRSKTNPNTTEINPAVRGLFLDHHASVFRKFILKKGLSAWLIKKPGHFEINIGLGYSFISTGQRYDYSWLAIETRTGTVIRGEVVDLSFSGVNAMISFMPLNNFGAELKFIHVPKNQLLYKYFQSTNLIMIKVFYRIPLIKQ